MKSLKPIWSYDFQVHILSLPANQRCHSQVVGSSLVMANCSHAGRHIPSSQEDRCSSKGQNVASYQISFETNDAQVTTGVSVGRGRRRKEEERGRNSSKDRTEQLTVRFRMGNHNKARRVVIIFGPNRSLPKTTARAAAEKSLLSTRRSVEATYGRN